MEVFWIFLRLGCIAFGGPAAHLAYFRNELIQQRKWFSDQQFGSWLAMCQFLPGPASSQMGFMLGLQRAGWRGGLAAFVGFTSPSVLLLVAFATLLPQFVHPLGVAAIHGLKLAACVIVADAVLGMAQSFCRSKQGQIIALVSLLLLVMIESVWMQLGVVVFGAVVGCMAYYLTYYQIKSPDQTNTEPTDIVNSAQHSASQQNQRFSVSPRLAKILAGLFVMLLCLSPLLANASIHNSASVWLSLFDMFYRTGALVFGGGHVVLPWLEQTLVGQQWLSADVFIAGYGATQAVPGPMFTFAAYLGALIPEPTLIPDPTLIPEPALLHDTALIHNSVQQVNGVSVGRALLAIIAVFLPGFLLLLAVLPVWAYLSQFALAKAGLAGVNAAVVGLLAAAWYHPISTSAIVSPLDVLVVILGFGMLRYRAPSRGLLSRFLSGFWSRFCSPLGVVCTCVLIRVCSLLIT